MTDDNDRLQELLNKVGDGEAALQVEQPEANGHDNVTPIDTARNKRKALKAPWQANDVHEAIAICAEMDAITYEHHRETVANAFDIKRLSALDEAVKAARKKTDFGDDDVFGWTVKQAPHPVDGAKVLDEIETTIRRYVVMPKAAATAITLWIAHAWTQDHADISPLLTLTSPEPRCGKTTLMNVIVALVPRPLVAANITSAALFRAVEAWRPTLAIDEADSFMSNSDELRGVINSGHTRASAYVVRAVEANGDFQPRRFTTWAPKVVASIGKLPATLMDRSVVICMKRKLPGEKVERLRDPSKVELFAVLRGCLSRWSADNGLKLAGADSAVPEYLHDRAADNWRTLIAIADLVGGDWPAKARKAAEALAGESLGDAESTRAMLLSDLKSIFEAECEEVLQSEVIVGHLEKMEHRPWPEWKHDKAMTVRQLAKMLSPFGIVPDQHWTNGRNRRGYSLAQCLDAFGRYLPFGTARTLEPAPNQTFSQEPHLLGNENLSDGKIAGNQHEFSIPPTLADESSRPAEAAYPKPNFEGLGDDEFPPIRGSR